MDGCDTVNIQGNLFEDNATDYEISDSSSYYFDE